jgi:hypothetical protein
MVLEEVQVWQGQYLKDLVNEALRELDEWLREEDGMYPPSGENGIEVAEEWAKVWQEQSATGERLSIPELSPQSTLRDVLNAAWLCRIRGEPDEVDQIAEAAYLLCEQIINPEAAEAGTSAKKKPHSRPPASSQLAARRQVG